MIVNGLHLDFDDLNICPAASSDIKSRSECSPLYDDGMLPLFAAPMDTVVSEANYEIFTGNLIQPIIPRKQGIFALDHKWTALSLNQFKESFLESQFYNVVSGTRYICIDIANGHMAELVDIISAAKKLYGERLVIMAGNVANPFTYEYLSDAGADYVRVGIGNGAGCLTTLNTGVGYPMASLIEDVFKASNNVHRPAKIVADGGMKNYSDIIKALALGADYVMIGSLFNKALESAGETRREIITRDGNIGGVRQMGEVINQYSPQIKTAFLGGARFYKSFRGMSTKDVQRELGNTTIRTSEGVYRTPMVEYTLEGWIENFRHYLTTAMSYTGARTLSEFIGNVTLIQISNNAFKRVDK